jgi:threonine aldolase
MSSTPAIIDLRSDTLTLPTPALREAMASAAVGDDVFGEDPTVRRLEERTAEMLGKEAALLTVSGTMANQLAVRAHTEPGDEILVEAEAHVYFYEGGGPAAFSGVSCRLLAGERGVFTAEQVERALRPADDHFPRPRLVCVENTHNRGGGRVWPRETLRDVAGAARQRGLKLHLDGARLWNAAIATGQSPRALTAEFDSVSVCFSKGLGAPVGSELAGGKDFIRRARRFRKMIGGGMRQAGIIAAGALHALEHHFARLADDHAHAQRLARALAELSGLSVRPEEVETNIMVAQVAPGTASDAVRRLEAAGVRVLARSPDSLRAVTHLNVTSADIDQAIAAFCRVFR